jgi:hypothetical protein
MIFGFPMYTYIKLGSEGRADLKKVDQIKSFLAYPETMEIDQIVNIKADLTDAFYFDGDGEEAENNDEVLEFLGDYPSITYVLYRAQARDGLGTSDEVFVIFKGNPLTSIAYGESETIKSELVDILPNQHDMETQAVMSILYPWYEDETDEIEVLGLIVTEYRALDRFFSKHIIPYYVVLVTLTGLITFLVLRYKAIIKYIQETEAKKGFDAIESAVDAIYSGIVFPPGHVTCKVDKKGCGVWIQSGALHIHQTKQSLLNKLKKNAEKYDSPEAIRKKIYSKTVNLGDICNFSLKEDKSYLVHYRGEEIKLLNFGPEAYDFISKIRTQKGM